VTRAALLLVKEIVGDDGKRKLKLFGLCGSLRARSSNRAMLEAYARLCADAAELKIYEGLAGLPHFNPDDDREELAASVTDLRTQIAASDAIVISTPEYAHGLPGSLKNALDWLVSDPAFAGKPVVLISAERGSTWAIDSLREILRTMSAEVLVEASIALRLASNNVDADHILARPELADLLRESIGGLLAYMVKRRATTD